jgi:REP element-mobilizing transposase RayT
MSMPQSLAQIYLHVVFSTKHRTPFFADRDLRDRVHAYLGGVCRKLDSLALKVGGIEDHVHILCRLSKTLAVAELVRELKRDSSQWVKELSTDLAGFYWQSGYGAFSVSGDHVDALIHYIANQESHHKGETFQNEFRRFLADYQLEYDERYVWD